MPKKTNTWRNRIVGEGEENPAALKANPRNWRIHSIAQQNIMTGVLDEIGWVERITVNRATGLVVDGHMRVALAAQQGEQTVPVSYVDLTPDEERLVLATLDPIGAMATQDVEKLDGLLTVVETENEAVAAMLDGMLASDTPDLLTPDAPPDLTDGFDNEQQHNLELANVMFSFGEYRVEVQREEYLQIVEDIRQQHGFDKDTVNNVLMNGVRGRAS